jgi:hypothetical protein
MVKIGQILHKNESITYIAAIVLDPCMKWKYISSTWQPKWITDAKALAIQLWNSIALVVAILLLY